MIKKKPSELLSRPPKVRIAFFPLQEDHLLMAFQDVESKKTSLVDVVQSLGEYINDEDPILRGKAVSYLTAVIKSLPPKFLSRQQIQVLTTFFCDRIEDGGAVAGLDTLQRLDRFNKDMAQEVAVA